MQILQLHAQNHTQTHGKKMKIIIHGNEYTGHTILESFNGSGCGKNGRRGKSVQVSKKFA